MLEYITVFGRTLPMYGIMAVLGFLVGLGAACLRCKAFGLSKENCVYIMAFGGVGAAIGAKIVYILTVLPDFIKDLGLITTNFNLFFEKYHCVRNGILPEVLSVRLRQACYSANI